MEEKKQEVRQYIQAHVNPLVRPLVEQIVKKRPSNVAAYMKQYSSRLLNHQTPEEIHTDSDEDTEEMQQMLARQLQAKKKSKTKKMSRQAISAQVFGTYNKKVQFVPKVIPKDEKSVQQIRSLVQKSILFQSLNKEDISIVIDAMQEVEIAAGDTVITQGETGDTLYIIGSGQYACSKIIGGKSTFLKNYQPGQFFGQLALMYNAQRAATITCTTPGKLFGLDRQTFNHIVQESASKKRNYYNQILSKVDILAQVDPYEKQQLCDALKEEEFQAGKYVVRQGDQGDRFYIIAEGKLIAQKEETGGAVKTVYEYSEGDYFGQIALVKNTVRQASIKAVIDCRVVSLDRDAFKRLLGPMEEILRRNMDKYKKYLIG